MPRALPTLLALAALAATPASAAAVTTPIAPGSTLILSGADSLGAALPAPVNTTYVRDQGAISDDGRFVAFASGADGLSAEDDDRFTNIFVKDRSTGAVTLVSRRAGATGAPAHGECGDATISDNGARVAFTCNAPLDAADANQHTDVYVRDLATATTTLASRASGAAGAVASVAAYNPMISGDGSAVVFDSAAANLVAGDGNGLPDIFRRELATAQTALVSRADGAGGAIGDLSSAGASVSDDGDTVAFATYATNLIATPDTNGSRDVYVRDIAAGTTTIVSAPEYGTTAAANDDSSSPAISGQKVGGQYYVAFETGASNLGPLDGNGHSDVYRRAVVNGAVVLVSRGQGGAVLGDNSWLGGIDDTGAEIGFSTGAMNVAPDFSGGLPAAYVRHVGAGTTELVSRQGTDGPPVFGNIPAVSGDGTVFAWEIEGGGQTPDADPLYGNAYVRDLAPRGTEVLARPAGTAPFVNAGADAWLSWSSQSISADGTRVAFTAVRNGGRVYEAWVRDLRTGALVLASRADGPTGAPARGDVRQAVISADGNRVAFLTSSSLSPADGDDLQSVYVRDLATGRTLLASRGDGLAGANANEDAYHPAVDGDGSRVAFVTSAKNLGDGDTNALPDVHVRDLATGRTLLASAPIGGGAANGAASTTSLDASGRHVAFGSYASNLGDGDKDMIEDVHVRDLATGALRLVSVTPAGVKGDDASVDPRLSADGSVVAFSTRAALLSGAKGDHVVVRDLARATLATADRASGAGGAIGAEPARDFSLSGDGRNVAWSTTVSSPGSATPAQVYLRDLATGTTITASRGPGVAGAPGGGNSSAPALSANGACVAFVSEAPLVPGAAADFGQVYVRAVAPGCGPASPPVAQRPAADVTADVTAPVLAGARLSRTRFAVGARATALTAVRRGTVLRFTSSEAAALRLKVQRARPGRRRAGRCVRVRVRPARRACTAYVRRATLGRTIGAGAGRVAFSGRIGRTALRPGRYRLVLRAVDAAGNRSAAVRLAFRVVR